MKSPNRETVAKLEDLPNIGKAIASNLRSISIDRPQDLIGKDPFVLYDNLCIKKEERVDPCVIDVLISVIEYMEGSDAQPWWAFTVKRKQMMKEKM